MVTTNTDETSLNITQLSSITCLKKKKTEINNNFWILFAKSQKYYF